MKKLVCMMVAVAAFAVPALAVSLAEASAKIGDCITDASAMTGTIKDLSAEDQVAFLAKVNAAIEKMPGSVEERAAAYLNANRAALKGAQKGNVTALLSEVFATVPPEALTVVNERFAAELFNRDADASKKYTDEKFVEIATNIMVAANARLASADNAAVRSGFAALMLVRAANGSPANISEMMAGTLPADAQQVAKTEWFPEALKGNYDPMLGASDSTVGTISADMVVRLAGPQMLESMLPTVVETTPMVKTGSGFDAFGTGFQGDDNGTVIPAPIPEYDEPRPYSGQR